MASPRPSGHGAGLAATLEMMEASMRAQVQAQRSSAEAQVKALEAMGKMPKPGVLFERVGKPDFRARTGRHSSSLGSQPRAKTRAGQKDWRDACHGQPPPCGFGYGGLQLTMPARTPLFVPEAPLELNIGRQGQHRTLRLEKTPAPAPTPTPRGPWFISQKNYGASHPFTFKHSHGPLYADKTFTPRFSAQLLFSCGLGQCMIQSFSRCYSSSLANAPDDYSIFTERRTA